MNLPIENIQLFRKAGRKARGETRCNFSLQSQSEELKPSGYYQSQGECFATGTNSTAVVPALEVAATIKP